MQNFPNDRETGTNAGGAETQAQETMTREEAGRMGGVAVVEKYGPEHMAEIGRKGGQKVSQNRQHMAEIGRRGGQKSRRR